MEEAAEWRLLRREDGWPFQRVSSVGMYVWLCVGGMRERKKKGREKKKEEEKKRREKMKRKRREKEEKKKRKEKKGGFCLVNSFSTNDVCSEGEAEGRQSTFLSRTPHELACFFSFRFFRFLFWDWQDRMIERPQEISRIIEQSLEERS